MDNVTVFTGVFGGYDRPEPPAVGGRHVLFTDGSPVEGWQTWTVAPGADPRREARRIKMQMAFVPTSLWLDGNIRLAVPAEQVVGEWLEGYDLALFAHPATDCIYSEARRCIGKQKDDPEVIKAQMARYRKEKFPAHFGLGETCILARRDNAAVRGFMARWWLELEQGSVRDQLSFDYVRWQMGDDIRVNLVDGGPGWRRREHPWFVCRGHGG